MSSSRTVLLTGCSSGIGKAIRDTLLAAGYRVLGVARRAEAETPRGDFVSIPLDLKELDILGPQLREAVAPYPQVNAVISNAGVPAFGNLEELSEKQIREWMDVNLTSHMLVIRTLLPLLKRHATSDVVIMGSEAALRGRKRGSVYCAAKFGLRGFAQALREECAASGMRVTLIHPGMVRTPFFTDLDFAPGEAPENAIAPEDVAQAVALVLAARPGTVFDEIALSPLKKVVHKNLPERGQTPL
ncbi:MAG: SDR family oxidoreductase [Planctomycetota bacterium]